MDKRTVYGNSKHGCVCIDVDPCDNGRSTFCEEYVLVNPAELAKVEEFDARIDADAKKLTDIQKKGVEIPTESSAKMSVAPGRLWMRIALWRGNEVTFAALGVEGVRELQKACEECLRWMEV